MTSGAHFVILTCVGLLTAAFGLGAADVPADSNDATRKAINLEALSRLKGIDLDANPAVKNVVLKVLDQVRGSPQFVDIVRDFNIKGQSSALVEIAAKDPAGPTGAEAMRLVLRDPDPASLKAALGGGNAIEITEALGNAGEKQIVPLLQPIVVDAARPVTVRKHAVQ